MAWKDLQSDGYSSTICWGCGLELTFPSLHRVLKCGWCGAISSYNMHTENQQQCSWCSHFVDRVSVIVVLTLIIVIICAGLWAVFPILFPRPSFGLFFHSVIATILAVNTLFNYYLVAFMPAGPLPELAWGNFHLVHKGTLEGHRFCIFCKRPKPPGAHHCRSCKACVLEMDHHCPFVGNCIGAANQRHFILFLLYAVLSNIYVLVMSIYTGLKIWPVLASLSNGPTTMSWSVSTMFAAYMRAMASSVYVSARALSLLYLVAASLSISIGVGLLLYQQLQLLYCGQTYIDTLQAESDNSFAVLPAKHGWKNLQNAFGSMHPLTWVFPMFHADIIERKVHEK
eukprot:c27789_g1_i1 orf=734-1756(+)